MALHAGNSSKAVEILAPAAIYSTDNPLPIYLLGKSYMAKDQGNVAGSEFQKILMRPGMFASNPVGALAQLEMSRASLRAGDAEEARLAYQKFFAVWKDADPDIPVMRKAQAEYQRVSRVFEKAAGDPPFRP